jgi:acyl carrier protein
MSTTVTAEAVCSIIAGTLPPATAKGGVTPSMSLRGDLGIDSMGLMSLVFVLEEQTGIDAMSCLDRFIAAESVADIVAVVVEP